MAKYLKSFRISVLFIVALYPQLIRAQWITYNTTNTTPISGSFITDITEGSNGVIWFGCEKGLWNYNSGTHLWQNFSTYISGTRVSDIEILNDEVWVATEGMGILCIKGNDRTFYNSKTGLCGNMIKGLTADKNGNIWAASYGSGISKIQSGKITNFSTSTGLPTNMFLSAFCDSKGNLWFSTSSKGIMKFNGTNYSLLNEADGLVRNSILRIYEDSKGCLWFCGQGGASIYNGTGFKNIERSDGLIDSTVLCVLEIDAGEFYLGTAKGISVYKDSVICSITIVNGLISNQVQCLYKSKNGILWAGHMDKGLSKYQNSQWFSVNQTQPLYSNSTYAAIRSSSGSMWFANYGGISEFDGENWSRVNTGGALSLNTVYFLNKFGQKSIIAGGSGSDKPKCIAIYNSTWSSIAVPSQLSSGYYIEINDFIIDRAGNYWLASPTKGLWARKEGIWYLMLTSVSSPIKRIFEDSKGTVWACAYDALYRFKNGKSDYFKTHNGLPTVKVNDITEDKNGNIWVVCGYDSKTRQDGGLAGYDGHNWTIFREELHTIDPVSVYCDHEGTIWVGGNPSPDKDKKMCVSMLKHNEWSYYSTDDGIANVYIRRFYEDPQLNMWLCTYNGISMLPHTPSNVEKDTELIVFKSYPNPSQSYVIFHGNVKVRAELSIRLLNMNGVVCFEKQYLPDNYGRFDFDIPVFNLNNGLYICIIQFKNKKFTREILVQH
jgi:ligand-binding sensor domain-containing protein